MLLRAKDYNFIDERAVQTSRLHCRRQNASVAWKIGRPPSSRVSHRARRAVRPHRRIRQRLLLPRELLAYASDVAGSACEQRLRANSATAAPLAGICAERWARVYAPLMSKQGLFPLEQIVHLDQTTSSELCQSGRRTSPKMRTLEHFAITSLATYKKLLRR